MKQVDSVKQQILEFVMIKNDIPYSAIKAKFAGIVREKYLKEVLRDACKRGFLTQAIQADNTSKYYYTGMKSDNNGNGTIIEYYNLSIASGAGEHLSRLMEKSTDSREIELLGNCLDTIDQYINYCLTGV